MTWKGIWDWADTWEGAGVDADGESDLLFALAGVTLIIGAGVVGTCRTLTLTLTLTP